ncbi:unnamed protein product, partial [Anisakis simplex]|uniref:Protein slowmo (inferred by orthology to a D. melanogaster protein) n=1 Tax=Anisakis simplex TaxID=6269 RepID=A0A0M3KH70_ANISI
MRLFFSHPWNTVVSAAWRKYPNPMNRAVTGIDVLKQEVRDNHSIRSERIIQSRFSIPSWAAKLTGFSGTQYSYEISEVDPAKQTLTLTTRNLNGSSFLKVDEKLTYAPDPENSQSWLLQVVVSANHCKTTFMAMKRKKKCVLTGISHNDSSDKGLNNFRTILRQEAAVTVSLPAFTDYCEKTFLNVYECN